MKPVSLCEDIVASASVTLEFSDVIGCGTVEPGGERLILMRPEMSTADITGVAVSTGIMTAPSNALLMSSTDGSSAPH